MPIGSSAAIALNAASRFLPVSTMLPPVTLAIELLPAATIHLRVTDAAGAPVAGNILLAYSGGTPRMGRGIRLELDEDGRATFARITPGPCSMTAHVEGRGKGSLKCDIAPGENTLTIQLEAK